MTRIFVSSGGGVRIGGTFGAELEGEQQGKFFPSEFKYFVGTSAGALDAILTANRWTAEQKVQLFLDTDFTRFFQPTLGPLPLLPFAARKALAIKWPISLAKLANFIDSLRLEPVPGLIINTVDADTNIQVAYCTELPPWAKDTPKIRWEVAPIGGREITRSMVLPGLVADEPHFKDGGIAENPLLSPFPEDAEILMLNLGYAGQVPHKATNILDEGLYAYEFKSHTATTHLMGHYPKLTAIYPKIYDVDSTAFNMSMAQKLDMVRRGKENSRDQWLKYQP